MVKIHSASPPGHRYASSPFRDMFRQPLQKTSVQRDKFFSVIPSPLHAKDLPVVLSFHTDSAFSGVLIYKHQVKRNLLQPVRRHHCTDLRQEDDAFLISPIFSRLSHKQLFPFQPQQTPCLIVKIPLSG